MPRTILITGATGFVGANLARRFLTRSDCVVHILIRQSSNLWRIDSVKGDFRQIHCIDLLDREETVRLAEKVQPDIIYHTAAYGGFPGQQDRTGMIEANLIATMHLVDAAVQAGVPFFIHTGSSSEYGVKAVPMREDDVCKPLSLYGITKLAATNYCAMAGAASSTRICTLRLFSPYGEWEDPSRLYPSIVQALEKGEPPRLSRPQSVRDFIPVDQVVDCYERIAELPFESGDIINVGSGRQQTIQQFYSRIARSMNKEHINPVWGEAAPRANEPSVWQADVSKLRALLSRSPGGGGGE